MPQWIHNRAEHLLARNPSMRKSTAFAIATQQSHSLGKTPKGYGTSEGKREAKAKYDEPKKEYKKAANPGDLDSPKLKESAVLPEFLDKPRRGERLEPGSEEHIKNRAFGRAVGGGGVLGLGFGGSLGGVGLGYLASRLHPRAAVPGAILGTGLGMGAGMAAGTAAMYPSKLKEQREMASAWNEQVKRMLEMAAASREQRSRMRKKAEAMGLLKEAASSPAAMLAATKRVGLPRAAVHPGKGIGTLAKPKGPGSGHVLPGLAAS